MKISFLSPLISYLIYWAVFLLCKEVFSVEPIVAAIIGLVASILSITITEIVGWKKISKKFGDCENKPISERFNRVEKILENDIGVDKNSPCLTEQHKQIEKLIEKELISAVNKANNASAQTFNLIKSESELRKQREMLLSANEYRLSQAIDDISTFKAVWQQKNEQIQDLCKEIAELKQESHLLNQTIVQQAEQIDALNSALNNDTPTYNHKKDLHQHFDLSL